jgi:hypothetical protein
MSMNAFERSEVRWEIDQVTGRDGNPSVGGGPPEPCSSEQTPPRNPLGSWVPDEGAFETFVGGAGI